MKITALVENTSLHDEVGKEHGLSVHIEMGGQSLLLDVGCGDLFLANAEVLGVPVDQVDFLVLSHAHSDHGGGIQTFLNHNSTAKVYVSPEAFEKYYSIKQDEEPEDIGLDPSLAHEPRVVQVSGDYQVSPGVMICSEITTEYARPTTNHGLMVLKGDELVADDFRHEQYLLVEDQGKTVLFSGCSHNGIMNIIESAKAKLGRYPDVVVGGFHLSNPYWETSEEPSTVESIGLHLKEIDAKYYTCHCTGLVAYEQLKTVLGDQLEYLAGGQTIVV